MLTNDLQAINVAPGARRCTFPLRDELGRTAMVLHRPPIKRSAHDIFGQSFALLPGASANARGHRGDSLNPELGQGANPETYPR